MTLREEILQEIEDKQNDEGLADDDYERMIEIAITRVEKLIDEKIQECKIFNYTEPRMII